MESPDFSPPHSNASRPSLGFPLGSALLLIVIFTLSGIFSCCYHWEKLRSLRRSFSDQPDVDIEASPTKPKLHNPDVKANQSQSLSVLMPGVQIPKFIALPCPCDCEPPRAEQVVVKVPKPRRFPVPLY